MDLDKNKDYKAEQERFINLMSDLIIKYADKIKFGNEQSSKEGVVVFGNTTSSFFGKLKIAIIGRVSYNVIKKKFGQTTLQCLRKGEKNDKSIFIHTCFHSNASRRFFIGRTERKNTFIC